jgi:hypothetical protein
MFHPTSMGVPGRDPLPSGLRTSLVRRRWTGRGQLRKATIASMLLVPDRTVSANDLCNGYKPGYVVKQATTDPWPRPMCAGPNSWLPGMWQDGFSGYLIPGQFPGLPAGSHPANPLDVSSDWVIPG